MSTASDGLQLRENHSFLHHRNRHLSKQHTGHVKCPRTAPVAVKHALWLLVSAPQLEDQASVDELDLRHDHRDVHNQEGKSRHPDFGSFLFLLFFFFFFLLFPEEDDKEDAPSITRCARFINSSSSFFSFLLLLSLAESALEEVPGGGGVHFVAASQRRHHQEKSTGSHVTDRGCLQLHLWLLQDARVLPTCSSGLLAPWSVVRHSSHLRRRVVVSFRQSSCDGHPLVSPPRAESSLPPPPPQRSRHPWRQLLVSKQLVALTEKGDLEQKTTVWWLWCGPGADDMCLSI